MLTLIESLSLAGDRAKQNDDACGVANGAAWVIDGATDLHDTPASDAASDAAWLAAHLNASLHAARAAANPFIAASAAAKADWEARFGATAARWRLPTASVMLVREGEDGALSGLELGDCRCFALDADGKGSAPGGPSQAGADESDAAKQAAKTTQASVLLRDAGIVNAIRAKRAAHNTPEGYRIFGLQPDYAAKARAWSHALARPAHVLLCTDGFSALVDRYRAYDAAGLARAALEKGLQELGRELRAIEAADAAGAKHPRFKPSDDATAVLLRLT